MRSYRAAGFIRLMILTLNEIFRNIQLPVKLRPLFEHLPQTEKAKTAAHLHLLSHKPEKIDFSGTFMKIWPQETKKRLSAIPNFS